MNNQIAGLFTGVSLLLHRYHVCILKKSLLRNFLKFFLHQKFLNVFHVKLTSLKSIWWGTPDNMFAFRGSDMHKNASQACEQASVFCENYRLEGKNDIIVTFCKRLSLYNKISSQIYMVPLFLLLEVLGLHTIKIKIKINPVQVTGQKKPYVLIKV